MTKTELANIIASHGIFRRLAGGLFSKMIDLVSLNNTSIPNFIFLGCQEVAHNSQVRIGLVNLILVVNSELK